MQCGIKSSLSFMTSFWVVVVTVLSCCFSLSLFRCVVVTLSLYVGRCSHCHIVHVGSTLSLISQYGQVFGWQVSTVLALVEQVCMLCHHLSIPSLCFPLISACKLVCCRFKSSLLSIWVAVNVSYTRLLCTRSCLASEFSFRTQLSSAITYFGPLRQPSSHLLHSTSWFLSPTSQAHRPPLLLASGSVSWWCGEN